MSGIMFLGTMDPNAIRRFYVEDVGMDIWLEQADCLILRHGNMLLGFCARDRVETGGTITFFYGTREEVDRMHRRLKARTLTPPKVNPRYGVYHFFAADPEDRPIEFQTFLGHVPPHLPGIDLLVTRRSVRRFIDEVPPEDIVLALFDACRFAPSARNSQPVTFTLIHDAALRDSLAQVRGASSAPIARAPLAVAISSDPDISGRYREDADIAAYHLMLAAWAYGLGTCWIADMDRDGVKRALGIPAEHYVATVTPLGYPGGRPELPPRKNLGDYLRFPGS